MSEYVANVMFHIDETLDQTTIDQVEYDMAYQDGVRSACVNCKHPHLMVVDYDPMKVKAQSLLHTITARGLHAAMVGL